MRTKVSTTGFAGDHVSRTATPRSRGALTGFGLVLLGAWGALIPFIGPYFNYAFTPNKTWTWTAARFWLQVLPGGVAFFAGLILLMTAHRVVAWFAAWMAIAAGAWFVVGPLLAPVWRANYLGTPVGDRTDVSVEQIGMFYGLGAAIILLAAMAAGRFSVIGVRDVAVASAHAERAAAERAAADHATAERAAAGETGSYPAGMGTAPVAATTVAERPMAAEPPVTGEPIDLRDGEVGQAPAHDGEPAADAVPGTTSTHRHGLFR